MRELLASISRVKQNFHFPFKFEKIVIFESDDWGSIRMQSKEAFENLKKKGYPVDKCSFNTNDSLEQTSDIVKLFDVLSSYRDCEGNHPKMTMNFVTHNPDFKKIKESGFHIYYDEDFTTLVKRRGDEEILNLYYKGLKQGLVKFQFHAKEHIHVNNWMQSLRNGYKPSLDAFEHEMFSVYPNLERTNCKTEFLDAYAVNNEDDKKYLEKAIKNGLDTFQRIWGYKSATVIPCCYIWDDFVEYLLKENGVRFIQSGYVQTIPSGEIYKYKKNKLNQVTKYNQKYLVRNVNFEPSTKDNFDWVANALKEITIAFALGKPAIVSSHRLNFISSLNSSNEKSLIIFNELLREILKKWPDVKFMSSDEYVLKKN